MKTLFKLLPIGVVMLLSVFSVQLVVAQGDMREKARQGVPQDTPRAVLGGSPGRGGASQGRHRAAVAALNGRQFLIRAERLRFPYGRSKAKTSRGGSISVQGGNVVFNIDKSAFVGGNIGINSMLRDNVVKMVTSSVKRNGDRVYTFNMMARAGGSSREALTMVVTLYGGGNRCSVRVDMGVVKGLMSVRGSLYPARGGICEVLSLSAPIRGEPFALSAGRFLRIPFATAPIRGEPTFWGQKVGKNPSKTGLHS